MAKERIRPLIPLIIFSFISINTLLAEEPSAKKEDMIVTRLGTVYVGMPEDKLYTIFQKKDQVLIPHRILSKEWIVFHDWPRKSNDVITFYLKDGKVTGWERRYNPAPANKGSIYEYSHRENIYKWFFPAGRARWDGSKLNLLDWNKLKKVQKVMFILEYISEINKQFGTHVSVNVEKYIIGMDHYADNCPEACKRIPAGDAINEMLISDGKAKPE